MHWTHEIRDAARHAGYPLEADVIEELAAHAQSALDAACARGKSLDEARAHVRSLIGVWILEASALKRQDKTPRRSFPMGLGNDLRYSVRLLGRQRAFGLIAILTMALSIGVMTTLFNVVDGVLLRPLPWPEPDRLVRL